MDYRVNFITQNIFGESKDPKNPCPRYILPPAPVKLSLISHNKWALLTYPTHQPHGKAFVADTGI